MAAAAKKIPDPRIFQSRPGVAGEPPTSHRPASGGSAGVSQGRQGVADRAIPAAPQPLQGGRGKTQGDRRDPLQGIGEIPSRPGEQGDEGAAGSSDRSSPLRRRQGHRQAPPRVAREGWLPGTTSDPPQAAAAAPARVPPESAGEPGQIARDPDFTRGDRAPRSHRNHRCGPVDGRCDSRCRR